MSSPPDLTEADSFGELEDPGSSWLHRREVEAPDGSNLPVLAWLTGCLGVEVLGPTAVPLLATTPAERGLFVRSWAHLIFGNYIRPTMIYPDRCIIYATALIPCLIPCLIHPLLMSRFSNNCSRFCTLSL